eukprot:jgi/Hompol1/495/HPOL_003921-RA
MDKLDLEDVIKVVCETISKSKRFSELSHLGVSSYLMDQLILKKSTNISGIGGFHIKRTKKGVSDDKNVYSAHFFPSKSWDKIPGFQIDRCDPVGEEAPLHGTGAAEVMNLSMVAQLTGFTRDLVEAGLKDIVHALFRVLKRGSIVNLTFGAVGKLIFQFAPGFLKALNDDTPHTRPPNSSIIAATAELDEAARKLAKLEELIDKTFSLEARNDQKCPICRSKRISYVEDRDLQKRTEQEHDRMLLHLSLDLDKDFIQKKRETEAAKLKNAISTAHYNHLKAMEKQLSHSKKESLPMGNLFENREVKRDSAMMQFALASGLKQQLEYKHARLSNERAQQDLEDRLNNERLISEIKAAELQSHMDKIQRYKQQQNALSEQIRTHQNIKDSSNEQNFDNPFARSESLMALYQKEKAKQLYQEQLAIVHQRQEYANRVAEIEKRHSLDRLALSRKELEKDLRSIKQGKVQARKGLEGYWNDQVTWKRQLADELAVE